MLSKIQTDFIILDNYKFEILNSQFHINYFKFKFLNILLSHLSRPTFTNVFFTQFQILKFCFCYLFCCHISIYILNQFEFRIQYVTRKLKSQFENSKFYEIWNSITFEFNSILVNDYAKTILFWLSSISIYKPALTPSFNLLIEPTSKPLSRSARSDRNSNPITRPQLPHSYTRQKSNNFFAS